MRRALTQEKIFFAPLKYEDIEKFNQLGPYFEYDYDAQIAAANADMASEILGDAEEKTPAERIAAEDAYAATIEKPRTEKRFDSADRASKL